MNEKEDDMRIRKILLLISFLVLPGCTVHQIKREEGTSAPLFDNLGEYQHEITTDVPLAQKYFDQGLILAYGFNHSEAIRSFQEATRLDPKCAMCYWGIALAYGPNINSPMKAEAAPKAYEALQMAIKLQKNASEKEQAYIDGLAKRYSEEPVGNRKQLDIEYANAMRKLHKKFLDDLDAATLFAEALMDTMPWNYWTENGRSRPGTSEALDTLEYVLERTPDHPGANHFFIHIVEASPNPALGIASADRLRSLVPGAGHLVHMPAHIYLRIGRYHDASLANVRAIASDESYITQCNAQGFYPMLYYPHNIHFLWYSSAMEGDSKTSTDTARKIQEKLSTKMIESQRLGPTLIFSLVRFGRWDEVLEQSMPSADRLYENAMRHYARGLAFLRKNKLNEAEDEASKLNEISESEQAKSLERKFFYGYKQILIGNNILQGELAGSKGDNENMIQHLKEAVALEDSLPYMEPPYWYYPVRQSLGAALLDANRAQDAEEVYREDLKDNPDNGWALFGLIQSLKAQGKTEDVLEMQDRFQEAWKNADISLTSSRF